MELSDSKEESVQLEGKSPATIAIAVLFFGFVMYFILESYYLATEYYAGMPPYSLIVMIGLVAAVGVFFALRKIEPTRGDTLTYALLIGLGFLFFLYPFITRLNIWFDDGSLEARAYVLNSEYVWIAKDTETPDLDLYIQRSVWWQQFEPGDEYAFNLRHGGLGFWQINMTKIYDDQRQWGYVLQHRGHDQQQLTQVFDL